MANMNSGNSRRLLVAAFAIALCLAVPCYSAQASFAPLPAPGYGNDTGAVVLQKRFFPHAAGLRSEGGHQSNAVSTRAAMSTRAAQVALPTGNAVNVRVFEISVSGTTYWGDANFLENDPNFSPAEDFQLSGYFFITDPIDTLTSSAPFDVGIAVLGGPASFSVGSATQAGATDWVSNSGVHGVVKQLLDRGYIDSTYSGNVEYCNFSQDEDGVWYVEMDTSAGISSSVQLLDVWNLYTITSSNFAGASGHKPVAGGLQFTTYDDGSVAGYYEFYGTSPPSQPFGGGTTAIAAEFQGVELEL